MRAIYFQLKIIQCPLSPVPREFVYSGVIIEKQPEGFYIKGYDTQIARFKFIVVKKQSDVYSKCWWYK